MSDQHLASANSIQNTQKKFLNLFLSKVKQRSRRRPRRRLIESFFILTVSQSVTIKLGSHNLQPISHLPVDNLTSLTRTNLCYRSSKLDGLDGVVEGGREASHSDFHIV